MPIESTPAIGPARSVEKLDARVVRLAAGERPVSEPIKSQGPVSSTAEVLDAGPVPIDTDRVEVIRKAVETGTYPIVPAKIADAVIAAGMLLRKSA